MGIDRAGANAPVVVPLNAFPPSGGPIEARLHYRPAEPSTARIDLFVGATPRTWTVDRSVLRDGLSRPSGLGEVKLWPDSDGDRIHVRLSAKAGQTQAMDVALDRQQVKAFVDTTYQSVTREEEGEQLAKRLDDWLRKAAPGEA